MMRKSAIQRFLRDESGAATMEFAVVTPFLVIIIFMFAEIGILTGRTALMKRGVDMAIRDVRLGVNSPDPDTFRLSVCEYAFLIDTCGQDLTIDVRPLSEVPTGTNRQTVSCGEDHSDPDAVALTGYNSGAEGEIMLVRACLIAYPVFPGTGFGAGLRWNPFGGYWITAVSAFMNESDTPPTS